MEKRKECYIDGKLNIQIVGVMEAWRGGEGEGQIIRWMDGWMQRLMGRSMDRLDRSRDRCKERERERGKNEIDR